MSANTPQTIRTYSRSVTRLRRLGTRPGLRVLLIAFLVYLVLTFCLHIAIYYRVWTPPDLSRWKELLVALWANAIFTVVVGLVATAVALLAPEDEPLVKRIGYLYPLSTSLTQNAQAHLLEAVTKLAAPFECATFHFILDKYDASKSAFYSVVHAEFSLRNIYRDDEYRDDHVELSVSPDKIANTDPLGKVRHVSLSCDGYSETYVRDEIITAAQGVYRRDLSLKIPAGQRAVQSYCYEAWVEVGVPWRIEFERYAERLEVTIDNRTGGAHQYVAVRASRTLGAASQPLALVPAGRRPLLAGSQSTKIVLEQLLPRRDRLELTFFA